jgi:hypothetical protein
VTLMVLDMTTQMAPVIWGMLAFLAVSIVSLVWTHH